MQPVSSPLPPVAVLASATLLWEACRRQPDVAAVSRTVRDGADPGTVVPAAVRHGLGPMLWRALDGAGEHASMGSLADRLEQEAKVRRLEAAPLVPRALALSVGALVDHGLEPVVLKGPSLAARYPAPGLRAMEDVDLLLPRSQHAEAVRILERAGWAVVRPSAFDRYDAVLRHPEIPSLALELHFAFEAEYKRVTWLDAEQLWERRRSVDCMGTPAFVLPPEEELVFLAQHAGKPFHSFSRLIWIADFGVVVGDCADRGEHVDLRR